MVTEWKVGGLNGELLRLYVFHDGGSSPDPALGVHELTTSPPFRYRHWKGNLLWKQLDHATTLEEAKACLEVLVRMG